MIFEKNCEKPRKKLVAGFKRARKAQEVAEMWMCVRSPDESEIFIGWSEVRMSGGTNKQVHGGLGRGELRENELRTGRRRD